MSETIDPHTHQDARAAQEAREGGDPNNRDPITDEPGAHPLGAGLGAAAAGAATGAAGGAIGGPIGAAAGAIIGGLVGGLAGKGIAEQIDPTAEHNHWRKVYKDEPYGSDEGNADRRYDDPDREYDERVGPAYQYGWETYGQEHTANGTARSFDDIDSELGEKWNSHRSEHDLTWDQARPRTRAAYERTHSTYGN